MSDSEDLRRNAARVMAEGRTRIAEARHQLARSDQLRQAAETALEQAGRLLPTTRGQGDGPEPAE